MIILVGDIGGTHSRIAYYEFDTSQLKFLFEEIYPSADYPGLEAIVRKFVASHGVKSTQACFGVAGPVRDGRVRTTNLPWTVDGFCLAQQLRPENRHHYQ